MPNEQHELFDNGVQKNKDCAKLPNETKRLIGRGKNSVQPKPKKRQRCKSSKASAKAELHDRSLSPPTVFLSDREAARRYSVSRPTVWRWAKELAIFLNRSKSPKARLVGTSRTLRRTNAPVELSLRELEQSTEPLLQRDTSQG